MSKKKIALIIFAISLMVSFIMLLTAGLSEELLELGTGYIIGNVLGYATQFWIVGMIVYFGGKWIISKLARKK